MSFPVRQAVLATLSALLAFAASAEETLAPPPPAAPAVAMPVEAAPAPAAATAAAPAPATPTEPAPAVLPALDDKHSAKHLPEAPNCPQLGDWAQAWRGKFLGKMNQWVAAELSDVHPRTVLYPFSGPDISTAMALFPGAVHYTLVADQVAEYPYLSRPRAESPEVTRAECTILSRFKDMGFYVTMELNGAEPTSAARPGFLPLLVAGTVFMDTKIVRAAVLTLDPRGVAREIEPGSAPARGVRLVVEYPDGRQAIVDYLQIDLSDRGMNGNPAARKFMQQPTDVLFLKSASHLLQNPAFTVLASDLTTHRAPVLVQDETGLDIDRLEKGWFVTAYGRFTSPHKSWQNNPHALKLVDYYHTHKSAGDLPFKIGYRKEAGSALLIGRRRPD